MAQKRSWNQLCGNNYRKSKYPIVEISLRTQRRIARSWWRDMNDWAEAKMGSPLVLRCCFWESGASWGRSGSAGSAAAEDGCETGGGAAQHPHLNPCRSRETHTPQTFYQGASDKCQFISKSMVHVLQCSSNMTQQHDSDMPFLRKTWPNQTSFLTETQPFLTSLCPQPGSEAAAPLAEWGREAQVQTRSLAAVCVAVGLSQGCVCRDKYPTTKAHWQPSNMRQK